MLALDFLWDSYLTHGSWVLLWPFQLLILRLQKRTLSWEAFWRRHVYLLRTTAQMVESRDLHLTSRDYHRSPVPYMLRTTALVTTALTVAGGSWYVAVNMTTASDLTAIYNCSAFFAYAFSIPLLHDKLRFDKVFSVVVAIIGVLVVAYGGETTGNKDTPDGTIGKGKHEAQHRLLGNIVIGIGSVLYGLYEVLYKRFACPPEGTSAGRSMIFANTFGSLIGAFTLLVLWIPLPFLHVLKLEVFQWPSGDAAWLLAVSVLANASEFSKQRDENIKAGLLINMQSSILRLLPSPNLPDIPRPLFRRGSPYHLPRRHCRLGTYRRTSLLRLHHGRPLDYRGLLPLELEHVS